MIAAEQLIHSTQQHEVDAALAPLLGTPQTPSQQEAFPAAACDMRDLIEQLDLRIAPDGETLRNPRMVVMTHHSQNAIV